MRAIPTSTGPDTSETIQAAERVDPDAAQQANIPVGKSELLHAQLSSLNAKRKRSEKERAETPVASESGERAAERARATPPRVAVPERQCGEVAATAEIETRNEEAKKDNGESGNSLRPLQALHAEASGAASSLSHAEASVARLTGSRPLGQKEMRTELRNLDALSMSLTESLEVAIGFTDRLKAALLKARSPVLAEEHILDIETLQGCLVVAQSFKKHVDELRAHVKEQLREGKNRPSKQGWSDWWTSDKVQRTLGVMEVATAMMFKAGAWYATQAIVPSKESDFHSTAHFAELVLKRIGVAIALAGTGEYILATDGMDRFTKAGGDIQSIQGIAQGIDQGVSIATLYGVAKATKQALPSLSLVGSFGLVGLGGAVHAGAFNKPFNRARRALLGSKAEAEIDFIDTAALRTAIRRESTEGGTEALSQDLESGHGSVPLSKELQSLLTELPAQQIQKLGAELVKARDSLRGLGKAILPQGLAAGVQGVPEPSTEIAAEPVPPGELSRAEALQVEEFKHEVEMLKAAARDAKEELPLGDERRAQVDKAFKDAEDIEKAANGMSENATPHRKAFFYCMGALGAVGTLMTFMGPITKNKWLSDPAHRAALAGMTSTVGQNLANLGQFLGGAKEDESAVMHVLKVGADAPNDSKTVESAKKWARNVRFLPAEFPLLQLSISLSEMADKMGLKSFPTGPVIRLLMEGGRLSASNFFNTGALGKSMGPHNWAALGLTGSGVVLGVGLEQARK